MAILQAFAIQDMKAELFFPPFFQASKGQATRAFTSLANDPQTQISQYPQDFRLVCIGTFDDQVGELLPDKHLVLGYASDFKRAVDERQVEMFPTRPEITG